MPSRRTVQFMYVKCACKRRKLINFNESMFSNIRSMGICRESIFNGWVFVVVKWLIKTSLWGLIYKWKKCWHPSYGIHGIFRHRIQENLSHFLNVKNSLTYLIIARKYYPSEIVFDIILHIIEQVTCEYYDIL